MLLIFSNRNLEFFTDEEAIETLYFLLLSKVKFPFNAFDIWSETFEAIYISESILKNTLN